MQYIMATFHSVKKLSPPSWFFLTVLLAFQLVDPTDGSENTPSLLVAACLKQSNCWLRYRFNYADHWNDCHGDQFLKRTRYDLFVGVVLCSTSRYKLFLSETMYGTYQQVGDSSGRGEDHCEFVNGSELAARTAGFPHKAPKTTGFYRRRWGERPRWGPIGNGPGGRLESTGRYYVKWYECDVNIPGPWVLDLDAAGTRGPSVPRASTSGGAAGVGGPLSFTVTPMNTTVAAGEVVTFECGVNQPGANMAWYFNDADLHTDTSRGVDVDGGVVLITEVTLRDAGEYVCVADGDDDVLEATAYLRVVDTLTRQPAPGSRERCNIGFGRTPSDASKSAGRNHVFRCSPADRTGRVTWWKDGSQLTTTGRIRVLLNGFLRIRRLTLADSGVYTCVVRPKFGGDCSDAVTAQLAVNLDCGRTVEPGRRPVASRRRQGRIVGGTNAPRWAAPWQVAVRQRQPPGSLVCGGVLIEHRWVLTAAHCFTAAVSNLRIDQPEDVLVDVGESDRGVREPEQVTLGIDMIISHPSFNDSTYDNDIALLQLENRVQFSNYVRPLCLASRQFQEDHFLRPNRTGTVTGWGRLGPYRNSPLASALQEIHVPYVNESVCAASTSYSVTRNMFCAGHRQGQGVRQDACQGDSGGPMSMPHDGKHYLVGLVSWGEGCGAKDKFGFYTKVANYYSWILRSIGAGG